MKSSQVNKAQVLLCKASEDMDCICCYIAPENTFSKQTYHSLLSMMHLTQNPLDYLSLWPWIQTKSPIFHACLAHFWHFHGTILEKLMHLQEGGNPLINLR